MTEQRFIVHAYDPVSELSASARIREGALEIDYQFVGQNDPRPVTFRQIIPMSAKDREVFERLCNIIGDRIKTNGVPKKTPLTEL